MRIDPVFNSDIILNIIITSISFRELCLQFEQRVIRKVIHSARYQRQLIFSKLEESYTQSLLFYSSFCVFEGNSSKKSLLTDCQFETEKIFLDKIQVV